MTKHYLFDEGSMTSNMTEFMESVAHPSTKRGYLLIDQSLDLLHSKYNKRRAKALKRSHRNNNARLGITEEERVSKALQKRVRRYKKMQAENKLEKGTIEITTEGYIYLTPINT